MRMKKKPEWYSQKDQVLTVNYECIKTKGYVEAG